jgi:preprotein translocase subunit SecG
MWMAFISLPIYFCGGADYKTFPTYFCSATSGVLWGVLSLWAIGLTGIADAGVAMLVTLIPIVSVLCIVHMVLFPKTVLGNCPMVFGGYAACFAAGGNDTLLVIITLTLGLVLGVLITEGGKIITRIVDKPQA